MLPPVKVGCHPGDVPDGDECAGFFPKKLQFMDFPEEFESGKNKKRADVAG